MSKNTRFFAILAALAIVCLAMPGMAATYFVDGGATGAGTGSDWANAFTTLGPAVAAANANSGADKIWMKTGLYDVTNPSGVAQTTATLITDSLSIYGGCAGTEANQAAVDALTSTTRSTIAHLTTTLDFNTITTASLTGTQGLLRVAARKNLTLDQVDLTSGVARIDVVGGWGWPTATALGRLAGGIAGDGGNAVTLTQCKISNILAVGTGGNTLYNCNPIGIKKDIAAGISTTTLPSASLTMTNCVISDNSVVGSAFGTANGNAVIVEGNLSMQGCLVDNNRGGLPASTGRGNAPNGVAVLAPSNAVTVNNCTFNNNRGSKWGALRIVSDVQTVSITNSAFTNNDGQEGGAIAMGHGYNGGFVPALLAPVGSTRGMMTTAITNCSFTGNTAVGSTGGAIRKFGGMNGEPAAVISNCTFTNNTAGAPCGAIDWKEYSGFTLDSCSFIGNQSGLTAASAVNGVGAVGTESSANDALPYGNIYTARNCFFKDNVTTGTQVRAAAWDAGKTGDQTRQSTTKLINCTFVNNRVSLADAAVEVKRSRFQKLHVTNCVFRGNTGTLNSSIRVGDGAWAWVNNSATDNTNMTNVTTNVTAANNVTGLTGVSLSTGLITSVSSQAVDRGTDTGDTTVTIPTVDMLGATRDDVAGVGTAATDMGAFEFKGAVANLGFNPSTAAFGTVNKSTMTTQTLTVRNNPLSEKYLSIALGTITGANASEFSATITGATSIAPGATSTIQIVWTTTGVSAVGARNLTLPLIHNGANLASPYAIPITGTLVPVEVSVFRVE